MCFQQRLSFEKAGKIIGENRKNEPWEAWWRAREDIEANMESAQKERRAAELQEHFTLQIAHVTHCGEFEAAMVLIMMDASTLIGSRMLEDPTNL